MKRRIILVTTIFLCVMMSLPSGFGGVSWAKEEALDSEGDGYSINDASQSQSDQKSDAPASVSEPADETKSDVEEKPEEKPETTAKGTQAPEKVPDDAKASDGEVRAAAASSSSWGVTYSVSTDQTNGVCGKELEAVFQTSVENGVAGTGYVFVLVDPDHSVCTELAETEIGGTVQVERPGGGSVVLHKVSDGFWFMVDEEKESTDLALHFNTEKSGEDEPEVASMGLYMGGGVYESYQLARNVALFNRTMASFGYAEDDTYVNLKWTAEEEDLEPVMEDEFTVSADPIYGYFHTKLPATFHAQAGRGSESNVFYVRQSADRAEAVLLKDAKPGDVIPAVDPKGEPITDRYGTQLQFHVTEDGFWFELDNRKHNNYADFDVTYQATDDAAAISSNAAKMRLYLDQNADADKAQAEAAAKFSPDLSLTWSDSGDKLHYKINLIWDTSVEEDKYDQNVVTTSQATLYPKYILDVMTSSVNYDVGQFEMRLPYALWAYRGSEATGRNAAEPEDFSIPKEGTNPGNSKFVYRIDYDPAYPNDKTKAQIVITNCDYLPAGTNARISVKYKVDPWSTVDLSKAEITVLASAQAQNQKTPETGESNTITYRLDTGFDSAYLRKLSSWSSVEAAAVYQKPGGMKDANWDPEQYNMVRFHINYGVNGDYNQALNYEFLTSLPDGAELVAVTPGTGGYSEIPFDKETGTWTRSNTTKSVSSSTNDYWFYVRFPRTGEGEADYKVRLDMEMTAADPDTHTPPVDYNDKDHKYLEWDFHWEEYVFEPPEWIKKSSYSKMGWGSDYLEAVKSNDADFEFHWRMRADTQEWYLADGETQYLQLTDDAHFWKYVPDTYGTNSWRNVHDMNWMEDGSWEFSQIAYISVEYTDLSHRDGSTTYPDFPGGTLLVQASKDGKSWDTIENLELAPQTGRSGPRLAIPDSAKYRFEKGTGYTRLRVVSPAVGRGRIVVETDLYTRIMGDHPLIQKWLDECPDDQQVYIRNYAAYQHFVREYKTKETVDPESGKPITVKTDELGDYVWDDALGKEPFSYAASDGSPSGKTLADRDVTDKQYMEKTPDGYLRRAYANGQLRHFKYYADMVKLTGTVENDTGQQRAIVPFTVYEYERVMGKKGTEYNDIYRDYTQDSGVFYELLPPGYQYIEDSAVAETVTGKQAACSAEIVENYRGSGRQLVKLSVTKPADPKVYSYLNDTNLKNSESNGYIFGRTKDTRITPNSSDTPYTGFRVDFKTYIPWKVLVDHPVEKNLASFQRTDQQPIRGGYPDQGYPNRENKFYLTDSQIIKEFKGTASASHPIDYDHKSTEQFDEAFHAAGGVRGSGPSIFTDIDEDGTITPKSSLYAYSTTNPKVVDGVQTGITKQVLGDEGKAEMEKGGEGWRTLDRTKLKGHYRYRITTRASMGEMSKLIVYDTLEDAKNKEGAEGEVTWKGTFDSVDVSEAQKSGFAPVVYYSTVKGLDYNTITGDEEFIWINDSAVWTTELPEDKTSVTAVAVDFRKMSDGSDAIIRSKSGDDDEEADSVSFLINMIAPDKYPENPDMVYAINRPAYSCYQKGFFSAEGVYKNDIGLRVKISMPRDSGDSQLPFTGGMGTIWFILNGVLLLMIAGCILAIRRMPSRTHGFRRFNSKRNTQSLGDKGTVC